MITRRSRVGLVLALILIATVAALWLGRRPGGTEAAVSGDAAVVTERAAAEPGKEAPKEKETASPAEPKAAPDAVPETHTAVAEVPVIPEPGALAKPEALLPAATAPAPIKFQDQRTLARETPAASAPAENADKPEAKAPAFRFQDARKLGTEPAAPATSSARAEETKPPLSFQDARKLGPAQASTPPASKAPAISFQDGRSMVTPAAVPARAGEAQPTARPRTPPAAEPVRTAIAAPAPAARSANSEPRLCPLPEIQTEPLEGGTMRLRIASPCRAREPVQIGYGGARLIRLLDAAGSLDMTLDLFAGASSRVDLRFADLTTLPVAAAALDLGSVTKVAILWRAPINLDLHAFEYAAREGQAGHIWGRVPSSLTAAREQSRGTPRGRGYLSTVDDGRALGDKLEVYTFLHDDAQTSGTIALALDYETRGESPVGAMCGRGELAEIAYEVVIQPRNGATSREAGILTPAECGVRLAQAVRLNQSLLPALRIGR